MRGEGEGRGRWIRGGKGGEGRGEEGGLGRRESENLLRLGLITCR